MKVAVYIRVSTLDQSSGAKSQEHAINRYLKAHGLKARTFQDVMSGGTTDRPQFQKLQKAIFNGQFDTVIVWKLDRLSRSLKDGVNVLTDWLEKGIRVIAVAQQLDFSGTTGQLVASVLFAVAQMERENIRENTKRGLAQARARGVKLGGRKPGKWTAEVKPLHDQGLSCAAIGEKLGRSRQAVHNVLTGKTPTYARK